MKRMQSLVATLALVLGLLMIPAASLAASSDVDLAKQAGQSFISTPQLIEAHPQWKGALLGEGVGCNDLNDRVVAYVFPIKQGNQDVGHIVVGSQLYKYHVLAASERPQPLVPTEAELNAVLKRDLGIDTKDMTIGKARLLYLGYTAYLSVYEVGDRRVAFDLQRRQAFPSSVLANCMMTPEEYAKQAKNDFGVLSAKWLDVPLQRMDDELIPPEHRNNNNCGPTSGSMVDEYYHEQRPGYGNFADPEHDPNPPPDHIHSWPDDHERLYVLMDCNPWWHGGVLPPNACSGFRSYATERGYNFSTYYATADDGDFTNRVVRHINANQPYMVLFRVAPDMPCWHWCTMSGYNTVGESRYFWINNPWGSKWDQISYDVNWPYLTWAEMWPSNEGW